MPVSECKNMEREKEGGTERGKRREKNYSHLSCPCIGNMKTLFVGLLKLLIILLYRQYLKYFLGINVVMYFLR